MADLRYMAKLVLNPADIEVRWRAGNNDPDILCRKAMKVRRAGEIAILVDFEKHETFLIDLVGDDLQLVPI